MAETMNPTNKTSGASNTSHLPPVKDPDAVQKGIIDVWGWVEKNAKLIAVLVAVLLLVVIAQSTVSWLNGRQEKAAQETYYALEAKFTKIKEGFDRAKFETLMPKMAGAQGSNEKAASGDLEKDYGTLISEMENFAKANAGTVAGAQAAIFAADTLIEYKQPEKAAEIAQVSADKLGEKHLLGSLARLVHGNALAAKGDCQGALSAWQKVLDTKTAAFLHADASLRSGLCFEKLSQNDKALEMYRKITIESPETAAGMTAKGLLRALEIKGKQG